MASLLTRFPFRTNPITMHSRMLGSVFNIETFCFYKCSFIIVSLLRSRGSRLPPMAELKAIGRTYLPRVECKIRTTSTWPIKGLWTIILSHYVSVTPVYLLRSLLLINDSDIRAIEPCICIPRCRTRPASRYPGTSTAQHASGYQFMFPRYLSKTFHHRSI